MTATPTGPDRPADGPGHDSWAPRWATVGWLTLAGVALLVLALNGDPVGAVLAGAAAAIALGVAGFDALARPALVADHDGLTVRTSWQPRSYGWPRVTRVEVTTTRRLLVLHALEIDAGDDLVLLSRRRLGADLGAVAERLAAYGAPVVRQSEAGL